MLSPLFQKYISSLTCSCLTVIFRFLCLCSFLFTSPHFAVLHLSFSLLFFNRLIFSFPLSAFPFFWSSLSQLYYSSVPFIILRFPLLYNCSLCDLLLLPSVFASLGLLLPATPFFGIFLPSPLYFSFSISLSLPFLFLSFLDTLFSFQYFTASFFFVSQGFTFLLFSSPPFPPPRVTSLCLFFYAYIFFISFCFFRFFQLATV